MEKLEASFVGDGRITLKSVVELETFFEKVKNNDNFILQWTESKEDGGINVRSKLIIASDLLSKVKNGELVLTSKEEQGTEE